MITRLVMDFFAALVQLVISLLPTTAPPSWVSSTSSYLAGMFDGAAGLGAWIPWTLVGTVFAALMVCVGIGFAIKISRIVASFLTVGGGSAG